MKVKVLITQAGSCHLVDNDQVVSTGEFAEMVNRAFSRAALRQLAGIEVIDQFKADDHAPKRYNTCRVTARTVPSREELGRLLDYSRSVGANRIVIRFGHVLSGRDIEGGNG